MAEISPDCETKNLQEFIETQQMYRKIMKTFMWPTVRTTWAEE